MCAYLVWNAPKTIQPERWSLHHETLLRLDISLAANTKLACFYNSRTLRDRSLDNGAVPVLITSLANTFCGPVWPVDHLRLYAAVRCGRSITDGSSSILKSRGQKLIPIFANQINYKNWVPQKMDLKQTTVLWNHHYVWTVDIASLAGSTIPVIVRSLVRYLANILCCGPVCPFDHLRTLQSLLEPFDTTLRSLFIQTLGLNAKNYIIYRISFRHRCRKFCKWIEGPLL